MTLLSDMLRNGTLAQAIEALRSDIGVRPADADLRASLVQLLCLRGDWRGALAQLKAWKVLAPMALPTVTLLSQAVEGELQRQQVFNREASPRLLSDDAPWLKLMVEALLNNNLDADESRYQALEAAPLNPGQLRRQPRPGESEAATLDFAWLTDGDDRLGPVCETIVNGVYHWISFSAIERIQFQPPASVTDLVWRHCLVQLRNGNEQVCQLPVRYPFAFYDALNTQSEEALMLAQKTEWSQPDAAQDLFIGHGQRVWLDDDREFSLLEIDLLQFSEPE
ncbi:type VI secretion system accessory protein TagJ [Serratia sp. M24T3]|uniref:type VI secretion system accessory protein TagJ n=1 Tax=Serratia sp. M24T3 TaxID=932213 RepID=UPI00025B9BF8|nr:type VI secretion system accessory protein TagJ [Serratia sp. M24T3]EIC84127.1 type VI secretion system protein ImpE [Serratia sp. M24T3]